jgi:hypothetical protein
MLRAPKRANLKKNQPKQTKYQRDPFVGMAKNLRLVGGGWRWARNLRLLFWFVCDKKLARAFF